MVTELELAVLAHDVLHRAGYTEVTSTAPDAVGYLVAGEKTLGGAEVWVYHHPNEDDLAGHARLYYSALKSDPSTEGLTVELVDAPWPLVRVYV